MKIFRLAIVENDEDERYFMSEAFKASGEFQILGEFGNGDQLTDWLHGRPAELPEIVLSDLNMPGKNGYDIIRELKVDYPGIAVIATSTSSVVSTREKCISAGAKDFIAKPDIFIAYEAFVKELYQLACRDLGA
ncbi:response regulator [Dyadobacter fermentans]|uniref:Response regulator receiver protein n=1 Tax=Dyadobacter fermentans (strain ATCC 700827 / DSM 18053 / CIP 107007 / KCTC 52180 / NS114) TaxID=471854 RepID=C6VRS2_DYAFD|nr:response regulator [Dyadobacter fermentans]ACT92775.1 response regulator receiver protein [Dyadobacter fermentans DSM 18053]